MKIKLTKPIVFFDLETTGLQIAKDRIVEIGLLKIFPNGKKQNTNWLINPTISIPEESTEIHGITNEDVKHSPTFKEIADDLISIIEDSDLAGYNCNKFDIPLLAEEFLRIGTDINLKKKKSIDVQNIFHKIEKRTLTAAYKFYCNKELINAHSATADTNATYEILLAQLEKYSELDNNVEFLNDFSSREKDFIDLAGFIRYNNKKEETISFGKYKGKTLDTIWKNNSGYFKWIINSDFPQYTKNIITKFIDKQNKKRT